MCRGCPTPLCTLCTTQVGALGRDWQACSSLSLLSTESLPAAADAMLPLSSASILSSGVSQLFAARACAALYSCATTSFLACSGVLFAALTGHGCSPASRQLPHRGNCLHVLWWSSIAQPCPAQALTLSCSCAHVQPHAHEATSKIRHATGAYVSGVQLGEAQ